jgi:hypothetical protein
MTTPRRFGSGVHVMLAPHRRSRQVVMANEISNGTDVVSSFLANDNALRTRRETR